jgi:hypothetical protein
MKKLLSLSAGILFAGFIAAQAVPNGGFENWTNLTFNDLGGYLNSNDQDIQQSLGLAGVNAVRTTNSHDQTYALQLTTLKVGADTLPAYVTNGGNPLQGQGGIPYAQKPTGISFWYESNIVAGDTAAVVAVFKLTGHGVIGAYLFPITVSQGSYTLYTKALSPALPLTPDTVIFAVISSAAGIYDNNNNKGCYPGNSITIDSVNFTGGVTQPVALNGDFENWKADTLYQPTGWNCLFPGSYQTTDFHAGAYAAQITTTPPSPGGGGTVPGFLSTGSIQNFGQGGYPYTLTTDTFEFYYKYAPAIATDTAQMALTFKHHDVNIGNTGLKLKAAATYTLAKLGFNIGVSNIPDSVIVTFVSSNSFNPPMADIGSTLKVDNAFFKSQQAADLGITEISVVEGIKIYPNPVTSSFNLNTEGYTGSVQSVDVYDMMGRAVISANYASGLDNTVTSFDMSKTAPGIYIVKVLTSTGVFYQKISKVQ